MQRDLPEFGSGSFLREAHESDFFDMSVIEQARLVGWANGCPVVNELVDPENEDPGRGPENMLPRYAQVNFWFGYIQRAVEESNPGLHDQLMAPVQRLDAETVGDHEIESVPITYLTEMAPMVTLVGYALPRLFTKQLGEAGQSKEDAVDRLELGLIVLDNAIPKASTPEQLLALVAEGLSQADVPSFVVLSSVLSTGWLKEHNAVSLLNKVKAALQEDAPTLWDHYSHLSEEEKLQFNIA